MTTKLSASDPGLSLQNLSVAFHSRDGRVLAVRDVSFDVPAGRSLGVVGESGSGKSTVMLAVMGLLPMAAAEIVHGEAYLNGTDLLKLSRSQLRRHLGKDLAMVFQDPMSSLNPVMPIGKQLGEMIRVHEPKISGKALRQRCIQLLESVEIAKAEQRLGSYPFEFSGGMRQRVMIAIATANNPSLLIADEPTTALDVTVQREILQLLARSQAESRRSLVIVSHDLAVVSQVADEVVVMYAGSVVETGATKDVLRNPSHPYTIGLLGSVPDVDSVQSTLVQIPGRPPQLTGDVVGCPFKPRCFVGKDEEICGTETPPLRPTGDGQMAACHFAGNLPAQTGPIPVVLSKRAAGEGASPAEATGAPAATAPVTRAPISTEKEAEQDREIVLSVDGLVVDFAQSGGRLRKTAAPHRAVDGVSLALRAGESLGLVGESGCGKSTTARAISHLIMPTAGEIRLGGATIDRGSRASLKAFRRQVQMVFQDPYSSLNPALPVRKLIEEPLQVHGIASGNRTGRVNELLDMVGIATTRSGRFIHEFSGGERQRIAIARALALDPSVLILDEAVASLDVSIQAQIINLFQDLQNQLGFACLFIAHDLAVVRHVCDRVAVMKSGKFVETGTRDEVFQTPTDPYTRALLGAVPRISA